MRLRTARQLGVYAFLIDARLRDGAGDQLGYRSAKHILARAPGVARLDVDGLGEAMWRLMEHDSSVGVVIQARGGATVGPWRIAVDPACIEVDDVAGLERVVAAREEAPLRVAELPADKREIEEELAELEWIVNHGGKLSESRRAFLRHALTSVDVNTRREARRLEALLLRLEGALVPARSQAAQVLAALLDDPNRDPIRLAVAMNELGLIAYREADYQAAQSEFERELGVLRDAGLAGQPDISRPLRCIALVHLRRGDIEPAARAAREAEEAANRASDASGRWLARAVGLRVLANRGGPGDAYHAMQMLERAALLAPVTDPTTLLFIRRIHLEVLYSLGDHQVDEIVDQSFVGSLADRPSARDAAQASLRDSLALGSRRDLDAVIRLVREHGQANLLSEFPALLDTAPRDSIDGIATTARAEPHAGRPPPRVASKRGRPRNK